MPRLLWRRSRRAGTSPRSNGYVTTKRRGDPELQTVFDKRGQPAGARLVAANRYARVYYSVRDERLEYCRPGWRTPETALLAYAAYPPPAISLAGPYPGYAAEANDGLQNVDKVVVVDVRRRDELLFTADYVGGVGSLKVNRRGSVAWIVCPFGQIGSGSWTARQVAENAQTARGGASIATTAAATNRSRCSSSRLAPHSGALAAPQRRPHLLKTGRPDEARIVGLRTDNQESSRLHPKRLDERSAGDLLMRDGHRGGRRTGFDEHDRPRGGRRSRRARAVPRGSHGAAVGGAVAHGTAGVRARRAGWW